MLLAAATSKMQMVHKGNCKALELAMNRKLISVFTVMQLKSHYSFSCKMLLRSYIRFKLHSWRCLDNSKTLQKRHIQWHSLEERGISVLCHRLNWRPKSRIQTFFCTSGLGKPHPTGMKNSHSLVLWTLRGWVTTKSYQGKKTLPPVLVPAAGTVLPTGRSCGLLANRKRKTPHPPKVKGPLMQPNLNTNWLDRRKSLTEQMGVFMAQKSKTARTQTHQLWWSVLKKETI